MSQAYKNRSTCSQVITRGSWSFIMYRVIDATSYAASLWFVVLMLIGCFIGLNLFLAGTKLSYSRTQTLDTEALKAERKKAKHSTMAAALGRVRAGAANWIQRRKDKVRLAVGL